MRRHREVAGVVRWCVAALLVLLSTVVARAQGYTVATATGRIESRPAGARRVDVDSYRAEKSAAAVPLPFTWWYYGVRCTSVVVSAHGWLRPGVAQGFADAGNPAAPHGQDAASGAFPYGSGGASADGIVAPLWTRFASVNDGTDGAGEVVTWTVGTEPRRRFVVSWERVRAGTLGCVTVQMQLHEVTGTIVFAYSAGAVTGAGDAPTRWVCGLDEPGGRRFTTSLAATASSAGSPPSDFVFEPRTVVWNSVDAPMRGTTPTWQESRLEALRGDDGANTCWYVAKGACWLHAPDRVTRGKTPRAKALADEDRATFPGAGRRSTGDRERSVRQVLDGKVILVPNDGGPPLRLWLRVIEFFTLDDRGLAGRDDHVWNLRILLSTALPPDDPRRRLENYAAWRAMATSRLTVGKLFDAKQTDDDGPQFDTGRVGEDVNWCARVKFGHRGVLPADDCPAAGWVRLPMMDQGEIEVQHADARDVRFVPDPNYVDSGYEYVVRSDDAPNGWISRRRPPPPGLTDEAFDVDPADAPTRSR